MTPSRHIPYDERPAGNREAWWENTIHHSLEPDLPVDLLRDQLVDAFTEILRAEPGRAVVNIVREVCFLHALRVAQCLLRLPQPKVQAFMWKYLQRLSDREIGRRLRVDHKTAAAWGMEVARALSDPQVGSQNGRDWPPFDSRTPHSTVT